MTEPLLALTIGELERLAAQLRASSSLPGASALNQQQIAHDQPLLREELLNWLCHWNQTIRSNTRLHQRDQRETQGLSRQRRLPISSGHPRCDSNDCPQIVHFLYCRTQQYTLCYHRRLPVDAMLWIRLEHCSSNLGTYRMCPSFCLTKQEEGRVSDDQIFYVIAVSLALTVCWIGASMIFGPF